MTPSLLELVAGVLPGLVIIGLIRGVIRPRIVGQRIEDELDYFRQQGIQKQELMQQLLTMRSQPLEESWVTVDPADHTKLIPRWVDPLDPSTRTWLIRTQSPKPKRPSCGGPGFCINTSCSC